MELRLPRLFNPEIAKDVHKKVPCEDCGRKFRKLRKVKGRSVCYPCSVKRLNIIRGAVKFDDFLSEKKQFTMALTKAQIKQLEKRVNKLGIKLSEYLRALFLMDIDNLNKQEGINMAYEKIETAMWTPEKEDDFIEGVFIKAESEVGANKSMLYHIEVDGKPRTFWGCTILDSNMLFVKPGDQIKVIYRGKGEAKSGKNPPKVFEVLVDRGD